MAINDQEWSIILKAAVDTTEADSQLQKYINTYKNASDKRKQLELELTLTNDADLQKQLQKRISGLKGTMTKMQKEITKVMNDPKMWKSTYVDQYLKSVTNAENDRLKVVKETNKKILQDSKNLYSQLEKLNKTKSQKGISDSEKSEIEAQERRLMGKINKNTQLIKNSGDTSSIKEDESLRQSYKDAQQLERIQQSIKQRAEEIKTAYKELETILSQIAKKQQEINQLESQERLSKSDKERLTILKQQTEELEQQKQEKMKIVSQDSDLVRKAENLEQSYKNQTKELKNQEAPLKKTNTHLTKIGETIKNIARYVIMYQALNAIQTGVQNAYETITELDKAFTDIQMVTGDTDEEIQNLSQSYNELAKKMGSTTVDVAEGATEWLRQGKTIEETNQLLEASMTLSKVGAMESAEATELLTSTLNGYKMAAEDAMGVVDKISAIDMAAATSSEELMTALSRTANSADDAGVSFDKLLAMIATTSSVTRKSASTIGESFKTIFARMSNVAAGKEIDDEGESLNDVESALNKVGIALRSSQNEWRNFEDVLDEVAGKWNDFTSAEQSQVATAIAGTRQQENFRALMNNWDQVSQLVGVAANSTGSATQKMETYLDSVEAKTNQLKNAWEGFVMSLQQSDAFKQVLDWLTNLLESLEHVDWGMTAVVASVTAFIALLPKIISGIKSIKAAINAGTGIGSFLSGGTLTLILTILSAIATIVTMVSSANKDLDKQIEDLQEQQKALEEEKDTVESLMETYTNLKAKGNVYGLTTDEKQKLVDVSSELVKTYGFEYDGIDSLTGAYEIGAEALDNYNQKLEEQQEIYSREEQDNRRKKIDERIDYLDGQDAEFTTANKNREMGKDFDTELYYSYVREREGIITEIQNQMTSLFTDEISENTRDLILEQIAEDAGQLTAGEIGKKYTDAYLSQLNDFSIRYDDKINYIAKSEEKFKNIIENNGALSLDQVGDYQKVLEKRLGIYKLMQEEGLISLEEYNKQVSQLENEVNSRLDFTLKAISDSLGENNGQFNAVASSVLDFTEQLKDGKQTLGEYSKSLSNLAKDLDVTKVFGDNTEATLNFFTVLTKQLTSVFDLIKSNYDSGLYASNNDYINDVIAWGESMSLLSGKMETLGEKTRETTDAITEQQGKIATIKNGDLYSYVMPKSEFDRQQKIQDEVANMYSEWSSFENSGYVDAFQDTSTRLAMQRKASENEKATGTYGISQQDYFDYIKSRSDYGEEAVARYQEIFNKAQQVVDESQRQEVWNTETNKYNEGNTTLTNYADYYQEQIDELEKKRTELQEELKHIEEVDISDNHETNESWQETKEEIDNVTKEIEDYQNKINALDKDQDDFNKTVERTQAEMEGQAEESKDAASRIADYVQKLKDVQDSVTAMEKINAGEILPDTKEFTQALTGIVTDIQSQMKDASGNIKQEIRDIFGETSVMYTGTMQDILTAYQNGEITLEQFQAALSVTVENNLNGLKNAVGDLLIEIGNAFDNFEITLKITMNTGNIIDKLRNALAGVTGGDQELGEIKVSSDAIKNTLSTLGNALKSTDLDFDFEYTPNVNGGTTGGTTTSSPTSYSPSSSGSGGSSSNQAEEDRKKLLEDIADFREDESIALEDVTEELINQYKTEERKLKLQQENLEYAEGLVDAEEETTKWIKIQNQQLTNQRKQIQSIYRENSKINQQFDKIQKENPKYDISSWFDEDGNATLAYANLLNSFAEQERKYRKTVSINSEEDLENAEKYIEKLEEERDYVENLFDSASQLKDAWIENREELQNLFTEMNDTLKEMRDTLLDKFMGALEDRVEEVNQVYEDNISKLESLITVQEKYNDVINNALDTQAELEKELQTNKDSYQYLDDYMRSIIFNEEDYKLLSGELDDLMSEMDVLAEEYQNKINNLTEDEMYKIEEITNEYERQVELKEKEYELLKAELDVVKARTKLENAKNERTVRMFVDGAWQWVKIKLILYSNI